MVGTNEGHAINQKTLRCRTFADELCFIYDIIILLLSLDNVLVFEIITNVVFGKCIERHTFGRPICVLSF